MNTTSSNGAAKHPNIVIKGNNTSMHEPCGICHQDHKPDCGPELFLEGTERTVCFLCGRKYASHLASALELLRKAEIEAHQQMELRRQALLDQYALREPKVFIQFDGWNDADEIMGRDEDGYGVTGSTGYELMHGSNVRVLIPTAGTSKADALALLRKIAAWVESDGFESLAKQYPYCPLRGLEKTPHDFPPF